MHYEFRMGERDVDPKLECTECGGPAEGDHSWTDGSGEICNACAEKDGMVAEQNEAKASAPTG